MVMRGTTIPPGTRLEFLYTENPDSNYKGDKAEDYIYFKENKKKQKLKIDCLHYLETQLCKPVTELLKVKYPRKMVKHEKLEDKFKRLVEEIDNRLIEHRIIKHRKLMDRIDFVIDSSTKEGSNEVRKNSELAKCAKALKSKLIIDVFHKKFGIRKRLEKRPTGRGETMIEIDGCVMKDILSYRKHFKEVIEELKNMNKPTFVFN